MNNTVKPKKRWVLWLLVLILGPLALLVPLAVLGPFLISSAPLPGLAPAHTVAQPSSQFLRIPFPGTDGIEIHYLSAQETPAEAGPGLDFLLLHGFTFNAFTWNESLGFFARRGRVVAYDQTPYGLSQKLVQGDWRGPHPYTKEAALDQLFAVMDALGMRRAILVGNSSGGTLALEAALARPERVAGLILVAPWVYVKRPLVPDWVAGLPQTRRLSLFIGRQLGRHGLLNPAYFDPGRISEERIALTGIHARVSNWDLAWGELFNRSLTSPVTVSARLGRVSQPALVITSDTDRLVPPADSREVAEVLPQGSLAELRQCGHVPQEECPREFTRAVADWLSQQGSLAARP